MPFPESYLVATNDNVIAEDHNSHTRDIKEIAIPSSATYTFNGSKVASITWGNAKLVYNYNGRGKCTSFNYQSPAGTTLYTYTAVYSGRKLTGWTRS